MQKKIYFFITLFIMILLGLPITAYGEQLTETPVNALVDVLPLDDIEENWTDVQEQYDMIFPEIEDISLKELLVDQDKLGLSFKRFFLSIIDLLFYELIQNGKLLGSLLLLTVFSVILQTMHHAFEKSTISKIAYFVIFLVLIFIVMQSFYLTVSFAKDAIDAMTGFMISLIPLLLGLMATFGNIFSVSFFHPIIIFIIHFTGVFISVVVLPLLTFSALLVMISNLSENYKVTNLASLLKSIALGSLGTLFTVFLGVMSVQGATSAVQDGVALKTAKFITGNFIPVVGRTFTDAADTILSAALILKNSLGIIGLIIILFICLFPAVKILVIAFIYKLCAAVLQPIGDGPIITTLETMSTYILYIFACLIIVSFMFLLSIILLVAASNLTLLVR